MGAKQTGTQTTTMAPPAWAVPSLQRGLNQSGTLLSQNLRDPFAQDTLDAYGMIRDRANAGSPLIGQAQASLGAMMDPQGNPYLDRMFNMAADRTAGRLQTEFAGAGRDVSASAPFRAQDLTDLATQIYGGAYNADQQRALSAASMAPGVAGADYNDAQALAAIGQAQQQRPEDILNSFVARNAQTVGQYGSQSQPVYSNPLSSLLGIGMAAGGLGWQPFSDRRVKRDITRIGERNGFPLYRFKYLWSDVEQEGHMADEVLKTRPDAVSVDSDGFMHLDYEALNG